MAKSEMRQENRSVRSSNSYRSSELGGNAAENVRSAAETGAHAERLKNTLIGNGLEPLRRTDTT